MAFDKQAVDAILKSTDELTEGREELARVKDAIAETTVAFAAAYDIVRHFYNGSLNPSTTSFGLVMKVCDRILPPSGVKEDVSTEDKQE
jgi:hypothetical protein